MCSVAVRCRPTSLRTELIVTSQPANSVLENAYEHVQTSCRLGKFGCTSRREVPSAVSKIFNPCLAHRRCSSRQIPLRMAAVNEAVPAAPCFHSSHDAARDAGFSWSWIGGPDAGGHGVYHQQH